MEHESKGYTDLRDKIMDELIKSINALVVAVEKMVKIQTESVKEQKDSGKFLIDLWKEMKERDSKFDIESKDLSVEKDDNVTLLQEQL